MEINSFAGINLARKFWGGGAPPQVGNGRGARESGWAYKMGTFLGEYQDFSRYILVYILRQIINCCSLLSYYPAQETYN